MQDYVLDSIANNAGTHSFGIISILGLSAPAQVEPGTPFDVLYNARNDSTTTQTVFGYIWDIALQQQITGSYWETQVAASQSYASTNHFTGISTAFSGEVRVGHITAPPICSPDGTFQCQGVDLYKCVGGNWVLEQTNSTQCGYVPPVCTNGQTKCEGTTKYTCVGGQWANPVPNSTDCGYVEPCSPENGLQCQGYDLFKCVGGVWTKIETNSQVCGYVPIQCSTYDGNPDECAANGCIYDWNTNKCMASIPFWKQPWFIAVSLGGGALGLVLLARRKK